MKKIVIGKNSYIAGKLSKRNYYVTTSRDKTDNSLFLDFEDYSDFDFDLIDKETFIVFLAAISSPDMCKNEYEHSYKINVISTCEIIEKFIKNGAHVLFFSSDVVYGETIKVADELAKKNPFGPYAKMKSEVEDRFEGNSHFKVFRLSYVFSSDDKYFKYLLSCLKNNKIAEIFEPFDRSMIYINDLIDAIELVLEKWFEFDNQIFNLCGSALISRKMIAEYFNEYHEEFRFKIVEPPKGFFDARPKIINVKSNYLSRLLGRETSLIKDMVRIELYKEWNV